jgi:F-type H+-transporting ATPase subunit alpha
MVELLKQGQYAPYAIEDQVVSIWAGTTGQLDDVPVEDVRRFERELLDYLHRENKSLLTGIVETGKLEDGTIDALTSAVAAFKKQFETSSGALLVEG